MSDIVLTPETLMAQSSEMSSLQAEYESLFSRVSTALNGVNECWSEAIASNFAGKITGAQKDFSSVVSMLTNGASAARLSAATFSQPGTIIPSLLTDGGNSLLGGAALAGGEAVLTDDEKQHVIDMLPDELKSSASDAASMESWLAEQYGSLPSEVQEAVESVLPSGFKNTVSVIDDIAQGNVDYETVGKVATAATGDSLKGTAAEAAVKASYMADDPALAAKEAEYTEKAGMALRDGNVGDTIKYTAVAYGAACSNGLRKIGYGLADGYTNIAGVMVDKVTSKPLKTASRIASGIPGDIGTVVQNGVSVLQDGASQCSSWLKNLL